MKIKYKLDYDLIKEVFNAPSEYFENILGARTVIYRGRKHIFIDRGSSVLSVAHLDYVNDLDHFNQMTIRGEDIIFSTRCDDRLGAYIILYLLPILGVQCDVLLAFDEEKGMSTAEDFKPGKLYKWMFEFDRHGNKCVNYMYKDPIWVEKIRKGFNGLEVGSCSDISYLEHLGCCAVNIGTGYYNEHTDLCRFDVTTLCSQVGLFLKFYQENRNVYYPHIKQVIPAKTWEPTRNRADIIPLNKDHMPVSLWGICEYCEAPTPVKDLHLTDEDSQICEKCAHAWSMERCELCLIYCFTWYELQDELGITFLCCSECEADMEMGTPSEGYGLCDECEMKYPEEFLYPVEDGDKLCKYCLKIYEYKQCRNCHKYGNLYNNKCVSCREDEEDDIFISVINGEDEHLSPDEDS